MKITDYSKIADNYDKNKTRHKILKDTVIGELYDTEKTNFTVLDLSCGTGNYLERQITEYPTSKYKIKWIGIDKSVEMINKARQKNLDAELIIADVIDLSLETDSVDYIKNRFAFHHYTDKEKAVQEMYRILRQNGKLSIENLNHEYMHNSWVYKYFPVSIELDNERFPKTFEYYKLLENNGFKIKFNVKIYVKKFKYKEIIEETKNRDMSQFQLMTENEYRTGLEKMEEDSKTNEYILGDIAFTEIYCEKLK